MFCYGYENQLEPSYPTLKQFAIFLLWVVIFCHLWPIPAYFTAIWGPYTPTESSSRAKFLGICFGKGTGTKWSFHIGFLSNLWCLPCGWSLFTILVIYKPPTPPHPPNCIIKLRFVANPFASFHPEVTRRKSDFNEEFGSFLFFVFWISLKWCILEA